MHLSVCSPHCVSPIREFDQLTVGSREYERSLRNCSHGPGVGKGFGTRRAAVRFISRYAVNHGVTRSLDPPAVVRWNSAAGNMEPCRRSSSVPAPELQQNSNPRVETIGGEERLSPRQSRITQNISPISSTDEYIEPPFSTFVEGK